MICLNDCVFFHLNEFSFRGAFLTLPLSGPVIKPFKRITIMTCVGKKGSWIVLFQQWVLIRNAFLNNQERYIYAQVLVT